MVADGMGPWARSARSMAVWLAPSDIRRKTTSLLFPAIGNAERRGNSASDEYLASYSAQRNHAATSRAGRSGRTRVAAASPRVEPIMVSQRRASSRRGECTPPAAKVTTKAKAKAPQAMS